MKMLSIFGLLAVIFETTYAQGGCGTTYVQQRNIRLPKEGNSTGRIVGGVEARPNSFPWIVSLQQYGSHFCGGTLIRVSPNQEASDIVVTAAHCVYDGTSGLKAVAGAHDLRRRNNGQQEVSSSYTVFHEQYDPNTMFNDIAIVKLDQPIRFSQAVQPACLPQPSDVVPNNLQGTVAGWGHQVEGAAETSALLFQVPVPVVAPEACAKAYYGMPIEKRLMICAGYSQGGRDACQGDSGGPFTFKGTNGNYYLQGVVSFGEGCARANRPGIYARVATYVPWIQEKIRSLSAVYRG